MQIYNLARSLTFFLKDYLSEMQNRNFNPLEIIRAVPLIGSVLGWLWSDSSETKDSVVGQSFDLESRSLSRRKTDHNLLLQR